VFNLDIVADEEARAPWEFTLGDRVWRLPHVADLTLEQQIQVDSGRMDLAVEQVAMVFKEADEDTPEGWVAAGKDCGDAIRRLRGQKRGLLQVAWLAHAGMEPGNSDASSS
jgi:hypothetical protein